VRYLGCAGVISGHSVGTFRPYNVTTRGQLTKMIVLAEGWAIDVSNGPHFRDVAPSHTFYGYVETALHRGAVSGYADSTFRPGNGVTRGQLCKVVVLAEAWAIYTPPTPTFSDVPPANPFFGYVETAFRRGTISRYAGGTFRPEGTAVRAQVCKVIYAGVASGEWRVASGEWRGPKATQHSALGAMTLYAPARSKPSDNEPGAVGAPGSSDCSGQV
jgi:trimeric autotransporter adhesin